MKHPGIFPLSGQRTCLSLAAGCLVAATIFCWATVATAGENLLANSSFSEGAPQGDSFGWTFDLAADQQSACSVVEVSIPKKPGSEKPGSEKSGPQTATPATPCLRIYNDERGRSFVRQQIDVEPWRWYVAEAWVQSDQMYSPDVRLGLEGGRKRGQWQYHNDYFDRPGSGWRLIRAFDHSGDSRQMTLTIGGVAFSGEFLISQPVVRECSMVEATSYHISPTGRSPGVYGPPIDPAKGLPGYAFLRDKIRRVARNFPNALRISADLPDPEPADGRVSVWLPPGIRYLKLRPHGGGKTPPKVTELPAGPGEPGGTHLELKTGRGETNLLVDSDLAPGEQATGYVSYQWNGGYQLPRPLVFEGVALPKVTAPKRIVAALDVYGAAYLNWQDFSPGLTGQEAMARDLKQMGFNRLQLWGGNPQPYVKLGLEAGRSYGGSFLVDMEKYPDSAAVLLSGQPTSKVMCPSYRGPGLMDNPWTEQLTKAAAVSSSVNLDDEVYLQSGVGPEICFCERCVGRWNHWVAAHHPQLAAPAPQNFYPQAHKYPAHYEAWLQFRCELVAERFGILRDVFREAVGKSGANSTPQIELGAFTGEERLIALSSIEALTDTLDFISPMIYEDADGVRQQVAKIAPVSAGKLVVCLAPGYCISPAGDARSQVLETVMGGAKGFVAWNLDIGPITTGHLADMSEAVKMLAPVEDIILDGQSEEGITADRPTTHVVTKKLGTERVVLISDYTPGTYQVRVTAPGEATLEVVDLFTNEVIARLDAAERSFAATLRPHFQARLYHLRPKREK